MPIGPLAVSCRRSGPTSWTSTSKPMLWPTMRPTTRARQPVSRRRLSRPSTSNGIGAQVPIASGSVSIAMTSSGRPLTVVCAVQVLMADRLLLARCRVVGLWGDLGVRRADGLRRRAGRPESGPVILQDDPRSAGLRMCAPHRGGYGLPTMIARLRNHPGRNAWLALSAFIAVGGVIDAAISPHPALGVPTTIAVSAAVALSWWSPIGGLVLQAVVVCAQAPFHDPLYDIALPIYALAATMGMAAARLELRQFLLSLPIAALSIAALLAPSSDSPVGDVVFAAAFLVGLPSLVGRTFRSRTKLNAELRERARRLAADPQQRAEEAAAAERRRTAAEPPGLVAPGVSG